MESFIQSKISQLGGCTVRATNKVSKTALKIQRHAQTKNATRSSCCGFLHNSCSSILRTEEQKQQQHQQQIYSNKHVWWLLSGCKSKNSTNSYKIANNNKRPLTLLLLIVMTLAIIAQQQQIAAAAATSSESLSSSLLLSQDEAAAASINELSHLHAGNNMRRTRLRKRHSNHLFFQSHLQENSTELEWQNPCNGIYDPVQHDESAEGFNDGSSNSGTRMIRPPVRFYMKLLRRLTGLEYHTLIETQQVIDISDMASWRLHKYRYKFLPNLKKNSSIALKRWYRNMQTYVASFAYLGRTQYKWDRSKLMHASKTSQELNELLLSARRILCEIETAINGSYPENGNNKLTTISREAMNRRLKFRTRKHHAQTANGAEIEADAIDLRYAKHSYYDFLATMSKILRKNTRRAGKANAHDAPSMDHNSQSLEDNASMSLRAFSDLSASSSSSSSESLEYIKNNSQSRNRSASRSRSGNNRHVRRRQQHKSADMPQINYIKVDS